MISFIAALALTAFPFGPTEPVSDLPLLPFPTTVPSPVMAVMLTGESGWVGVDRTITQTLINRGIPVVGFDMPAYLKNKRTADQMGADLARVVRFYLDSWDADKVLLIGDARGAAALTFMAARLPADLRSKVKLVGLLEPGLKLESMPTLPETAQLNGLDVVCVYGRKESNTLCPEMPPAAGSVIVTDGNRHLDKDYALLTDLLLERAAH
jgi:type IV secretory pathway VirJ component